MPADALDGIPRGEVYIRQGEVIAAEDREANAARPLDRARTHRHALGAARPLFEGPGGAIRVASSREFPLCADMTGVVTRLRPGALHAPHWHPNANEWFYVSRGQVRATMFAADKRLATAELSAGDCAYTPANCAHLLRNTGTDECEIVAALDSGSYLEGSVSAWMADAPLHTLANNLGLSEAALARFGDERIVIAAP